MPKLRVHNLAVSIDGFAAGPRQSVDDPLGVDGMLLHEWVFATPRHPVDERFIAAGDDGIGATILGRNMFGPIRGRWPDEAWRGWWGENPPYHHDVFVLTHHARPGLPMDGGTTFHFVTDGPEAALERAFAAADGADVRLGGGPATIQQYLNAGLVDEVHVAIVPVLLRDGERLFDHLTEAMPGMACVELVASASVAHVRLARQRS